MTSEANAVTETKTEERTVPYSIYQASVKAALEEVRDARRSISDAEDEAYRKGYIRGSILTALLITVGNILWIVIRAL